MPWRHTIMAGLSLAGVVVLAMLMAWFAGEGPYEHHVPLLTGPQSCVLTIGDPSHTSPVLDVRNLTNAPVCLLQQRIFVQMQGIEVWTDAGEMQVELYARLAGQYFPVPSGDVVFAADGFGIRGVTIRGTPRYAQIILRFTAHTDEAQHGWLSPWRRVSWLER
jgi:hypothetical protein